MLRPIRMFIYRRGFRPKYGSIFWSMEGHMKYVISPAVMEGLRRGFSDSE